MEVTTTLITPTTDTGKERETADVDGSSIDMLGRRLAQMCCTIGVRTAAATATATVTRTSTATSTTAASAAPGNKTALQQPGEPYSVPLLSIAPMMEVTDRHYRTFARMLTKHTHLYTEMVADNAVIHGRGDLITFDPAVEEPLTMQLGGSEPEALAEAAAVCVARGYTEINLNVGCPSSRGQGNCRYGAVLMNEPELVAACMQAMIEAVPPEVACTVKCRIGVDANDSYEALKSFIDTVHNTTHPKVTHFVIHARKAILDMQLSPEQNRNIPPLKHEIVYQLIEDYPHLVFTINGGIKTLEEANEHLAKGVHGVMIGRAAYKTPWEVLSKADSTIFGEDDSGLTRRELLVQYGKYADKVMQEDTGAQAGKVLRPLSALFAGKPKAATFRKVMERERKAGKCMSEILATAMEQLDDALLDSRD